MQREKMLRTLTDSNSVFFSKNSSFQCVSKLEQKSVNEIVYLIKVENAYNS